jgi:hypothetical protein
VRLIRSKGVGIFFVTQTPKDVPADVLAQLGSRVQHQLRTHTPDDARALKATVSTYPVSAYDLAQVLQNLPTGEAIVTVMNEKGAPSPVAWTRMRVPQSSMSPTSPDARAAAVSASPLLAAFDRPVPSTSARDILAQREAAAEAAEAAARAAADQDAEKDRTEESRTEKRRTDERGTEKPRTEKPERPRRTGRASPRRSDTIARRIIGKLFGSTR